jgi:hypothetical protein
MSEAGPSEAAAAGQEAGAPTGDGISRQLWLDAQPDIQACLHHPFVRALGAGTLPKCDPMTLLHCETSVACQVRRWCPFQQSRMHCTCRSHHTCGRH